MERAWPQEVGTLAYLVETGRSVIANEEKKYVREVATEPGDMEGVEVDQNTADHWMGGCHTISRQSCSKEPLRCNFRWMDTKDSGAVRWWWGSYLFYFQKVRGIEKGRYFTCLRVHRTDLQERWKNGSRIRYGRDSQKGYRGGSSNDE